MCDLLLSCLYVTLLNFKKSVIDGGRSSQEPFSTFVSADEFSEDKRGHLSRMVKKL